MSDVDRNPMPLLNCSRCTSTLGQDQIGLCDGCQEEDDPPSFDLVVQLLRTSQSADTDIVGLELTVDKMMLDRLHAMREACRSKGLNAESRLGIEPIWLAVGVGGSLVGPEIVVDVGGIRFEARAYAGEGRCSSPWINLGVLADALESGVGTAVVSNDDAEPLAFLLRPGVDVDISGKVLIISPRGAYLNPPAHPQVDRPRVG